MDIKDLVEKTRSYRRFDESHTIPMEVLLELLELSRLSASAANRQPLRYYLVNDREIGAEVFKTLAWAAYLPEWPGPEEGERPSAYIVLCIDTTIAKDWWCDDGIAAQTMMLGATALGLGGCMIGGLKQEQLRELLEVPPHLKIRLVLAFGKPAETVRIDPLGEDGSIKYWRDADSVHHVPKRSLDDLIVKKFGK